MDSLPVNLRSSFKNFDFIHDFFLEHNFLMDGDGCMPEKAELCNPDYYGEDDIYPYDALMC